MIDKKEFTETGKLDIDKSHIKQLDRRIASLERQLRSSIRLIDDNAIRTRNKFQATKYFICVCYIVLGLLYQPKQSAIDFTHFIFFPHSAQKDVPINLPEDSI